MFTTWFMIVWFPLTGYAVGHDHYLSGDDCFVEAASEGAETAVLMDEGAAIVYCVPLEVNEDRRPEAYWKKAFDTVKPMADW